MKKLFPKQLIGLLSLFAFIGIYSLSTQFVQAKSQKNKKLRRVKKAKRAKKVTRYGWLFTSDKNFPTSAESMKGLRKKASKANKDSYSKPEGNEVEFNFMLILKRKLRKGKLLLIAFRVGQKEHLDVVDFGSQKTSLFLSNLSFTSTEFKKGGKFEIRAIRVTKHRKKLRKRILATTFFELK